MSPVFPWLEKSLAKTVLTAVLPVSLSADSETPLLQTIVPQKIESSINDAKVTYLVRIEGKTYTFHLEKQSFLHPRFMAYSHSKLGTLQLDYSLIKGHCFYQGHAVEIPASTVTLSTCSGLRGLLQLENITYGIEPLQSLATFEHIIYQIKNNKIDYSPLKENLNLQHESQSYRILVKPEKGSNVSLMKRMLSVKVIVDKAMFGHMGSEMGVAVQKVVHIFGLINTMFSQLKMTVMLTSLEIWSDQNKIETNGDADEVLQRFLLWKQKQASERAQDITYLLLYKDYPDYVGATYHGIACNPKFTAGIALHPKTLTVEGFAVVLSQLLGINLGLTYDDVYNCFCPGSVCIMNPSAIRSQGVKVFSSCSLDGFKQLASQPELDCLQNKPVPETVALPQGPVCGNGKLEEPEECDCGPPETCRLKGCCNAESCTLRKPAACGSGACCDRRTCKVAERGHLCRKSTDLCDFPEFCNGQSEHCVPDVKAADLEPCNNYTAYCFGGICRDLDRQCMDLFGKHARGPNYLCIQEVNIQNDKFGNCHGRCNYSAVFCGKVACIWDRTEIISTDKYDVQYTYIGGHVCVSAHLRNPEGTDDTYVHDGTICGGGKACIQGKCLRVHAYRGPLQCDSEKKCQGNGICNTLHNCQCDVGYAPPECDMTPSSPGGSFDDGFWLPFEKSTPLIVKQRGARYKKGLLISFYVFLPFLIMFAICVIKQNIPKGFQHKEETVVSGGLPGIYPCSQPFRSYSPDGAAKKYAKIT
ncbi:A disintegrin and metallopeptidase domain 3-like [Peromyscus californicus insignis]|uniref:A disintegrin and metallopeptidase domain 3-like n=1 Tax=Peromyscus californicus insignis TaxID=564181 RepID=UPI0022A74CA9|nr:A disintegrin and metallopeptidase domain 3-like [Peromyscus californicus insignis]